MKKIKLTENVFVLTFADEKEFNVPLLLDGKKALLIDTGYPEDAEKLWEFLKEESIEPEIIINSHFHPDHFSGNFLFSRCEFVGSEHYKQNFELFEALNPNIDHIPPKTLVKNGEIIQYGAFELKFLNLKGHSQDSLVTIITQQDTNLSIAHVGDLLMFSNDGKHVIPYISYDGNIDEHIESLLSLLTLNIDIFIPSHGIIVKDKNQLKKAIEIRLHYLKRLKALGKSTSIEDCLLGPEEEYHLLHLHYQNVKNIFG